ncbi:uncharacterized protein BKCO1_4200012 [Diplodia corticola]|uniref:Uncharacterized protein n=1 Tax=Diplodia corticola TaxID=236234 RepID=A0A1J9QVE8_9PEZI|nr:uncharacterized protein BKCO1_4200012 [Diplodia corticola]OJD31970.1 hypothetical protein BKCO1_4200012 [Diplodia corticola]
MGPSLLGVSREVRDLIWESCLTTPRSPPPLPAGDRTDNPEWEQRYFFCANEDECMIGYPPRTPHIECIPLLQTSRQINAEIHETIARLYTQRRMDCNLQLTIYREKYFLLDWLCLPVNSLHYDDWKVNFRLVEPPVWRVDKESGEPEQSMLETFHPDRYPRVLWCYFYILQRFLERGPGFRSHPEFHITQAPPKTRSLRRLIVDISTKVHLTSSSPPTALPQKQYRGVGRHSGRLNRRPRGFDEWHAFYTGGIIDPAYYAEQARFLTEEWIFSSKLQSQARMAFESYERIQMRMDGRAVPGAEWDLRTLTGSAYECPNGVRCAVLDHNTGMTVQKLYGCLVDPEVVRKREYEALATEREGRAAGGAGDVSEAGAGRGRMR